jgi:hypothetical protein
VPQLRLLALGRRVPHPPPRRQMEPRNKKVLRLSCRGVASARPGRQAASCPCIHSKGRNHLNSVCALTFFRLVGARYIVPAELRSASSQLPLVMYRPRPRPGRGLSGAVSPERRRCGTIVGQAFRPDSQSDEACKGWENVPSKIRERRRCGTLLSELERAAPHPPPRPQIEPRTRKVLRLSSKGRNHLNR